MTTAVEAMTGGCLGRFFPLTLLRSLPHLVAALLPANAALAQSCEGTWVSGIGLPQPGFAVNALVNADPNGTGVLPLALVAGGDFTFAGDLNAHCIARGDGAAWSALSTGMTCCNVYALAVLPNGDVVAGGYFSAAGGVAADNIARWDGTTWSAVGGELNGGVSALAVQSDGDLVAGGDFTLAEGLSVNGIARWNGSTWSALGTGMNISAQINALVVLPNGDLVAGGHFTTAGGVAVNNIARWDGTAWSALGTGIDGYVVTLAVLPSGDVIAGGAFVSAGGTTANGIACWNGLTWSALGAGADGGVTSLAVLPGGDVVAGGYFSVGRIAHWNGEVWSPLGSGMINGRVSSLLVLPSGDLVVGGRFNAAGGVAANSIAKWMWTHHVPPSIDQHPLPALACPTGTASFGVYASGTGPLTHTWQIQASPGVWLSLSGDPLPLLCGGEAFVNDLSTISPTVSIGIRSCAGSPPVPEHFQVRCIVTNACASATSNEATYTICPADFDCSDALSVADIFAFLNAWFAGDPRTDFNDINGINVSDIFAFLNAWFGGCP